MRFSRSVALLSLLTVAGLIASGFIVDAGSRQSLELQQNPEQKIASWVIAKTDNGADAEFLVILKDQADLSAAASLPAKEEKGRYVFETLRTKMRVSQASLIDFLKQRTVEYKPFFVINAVLVKGSRALVNEIAARNDVDRVVGNPIIPGIMPIKSQGQEGPGEAETRNLSTADPEAVEPGVSYIHAPEVWAMGFTGQGIVIGGQDTGVDWNHPALQEQYRGWDSANVNHDYNWHDSIHKNGGSCGADTNTPCDDFNHGTHTVGSAVGTDGGANQIGVAPGAKFIACRNMDQGNGTPASYLECFEFFLAPYPVGASSAEGNPAKAPDITINSWGCPPSEGCEPDTLKLAVEAHRAAGIFTVVSAGNGGIKGCGSVADPPALYDAVYSVGAIDVTTGGIASFSSRGPVTIDASNRIKPDISAPGVGIRSAIRGGNYARLSGTSMASPHTAGAVALLWSAYPWLRGQIELTENLLNESAVHVEADSCGTTTSLANSSADSSANSSAQFSAHFSANSSGGFPNNVFGFGRLDIKFAVDLASTIVTPAASALASTIVNPTNLQVGARGGAVKIGISTLPTVTWRAVSKDSWIAPVITSDITGNGERELLVSENIDSQSRSGRVMIAGHVVTVTQQGSNLPFTVAGRIVNGIGEGVGKVTLSFARVSGSGGIPASVQTGDDGSWRQSGFEPGTVYRATPGGRRQSFSPTSRDFNTSSSTLDFTVVGRGIIISRTQ